MRVIKFFAIMIVMLVCIAFSACDDSSGSNSKSSGPDVYAGGYYFDEYDNPHACLWKNSALIEIENSAKQSIINCMAQSEGIVYAGGYCKNGTILEAGYWKQDGAWTALESSLNSEVLAITANENGIYAGGYINNGSKDVPGYWRNNAWVPLANTVNSSSNARVQSIFVSGTDVYAGGYCLDSIGIRILGYWKPDGSWIEIAGSSLSSMDNTGVIYISGNGNNIFLGGNYLNTGYDGFYYNGSSIILLDNPINSAQLLHLYSFATDGTSIYAGGQTYSNVGGYYKNDGGNTWAWKSLPNGTGGDLTNVCAVYLDGSDFYAGGWSSNFTQDKYFACYWKNGAYVNMQNTDNWLHQVNAIIIMH